MRGFSRSDSERHRVGAVLVAVVVLLVGVGAAGGAAGSGPDGGVGPDGAPVVVELTVRHSRFVPDVVEVPVGREVRFVVVNTDPIDHELILGPQSVQDAHEKGTHAVHGAVPGEVSVGAGSTAATSYVFTEPGEVLMGCHLPGHWDYGMRGQVRAT